MKISLKKIKKYCEINITKKCKKCVYSKIDCGFNGPPIDWDTKFIEAQYKKMVQGEG